MPHATPLLRALHRGLGPGPTRLHVSLRWQLQLERAGTRANRETQLTAREVATRELDDLLAKSKLSVSPAARGGHAPWRAFLVFAEGRPVHHTFVSFERTTPLLFNVLTDPDHRGRGAFREVMLEIREALLKDGYTRLESSCSGTNHASIRAHHRLGFRVVARSYHPYLLGVALRPWARRLRYALRTHRR